MKHGTFYAVCLLAISLFLWWREGWVAGGVLLFLGLCFGMSLGLFRDVRQVKKIARSGRWCRVRIVERLEETSRKGEALLRLKRACRLCCTAVCFAQKNRRNCRWGMWCRFVNTWATFCLSTKFTDRLRRMLRKTIDGRPLTGKRPPENSKRLPAAQPPGFDCGCVFLSKSAQSNF